MKRAAAGLILGVVVLACPSPSQATFPGSNGRLVFAVDCDSSRVNPEPSDCEDNARNFRAINPRTGRRLPFDAGCTRRCRDTEPRFSPGGLRLAFNRFATGAGRARVFISDADGSRAKQIRRFGDSPSWSPNGKALAIGGEAGIRIIRPNGAFVRRVTTVRAYSLDWSVRGQIVFTGGKRNDLYTVSGRGGRIRRISRCCPYHTSWSPDGRRLIFYRFPGRTSRRRATASLAAADVVVMDADGSNRHRVGGGYTPVWSPDGRRIAFRRGGPSSGVRVVIARPDGTGRRIVHRISGAVLPSIGDFAWQPRPR